MRCLAGLALTCLAVLASCTWRQSLLTLHDASRAEDTSRPEASRPEAPVLDAPLPQDAPVLDAPLPQDAPVLDAPLPQDAPVLLDATPIGDAASVCVGRRKVDAGTALTDGLLVWYRCDSLSGTTLPDSSGRGNDGTLVAAAGSGSAGAIVAGKVGNALELQFANKGYVSMPQGLLAKACEFTIATWVYLNKTEEDSAWARIWDFGIDKTRYMFLTPITNTDNLARFGISVSGNTHEETLKAKAPVPTSKWTHVAVAVGPSGGALYFDGEVVASNDTMTLRPADLGVTVNNSIGLSDFPDPYLDGVIDDFRVYDRALSGAEIRSLATVP
jgi:hypothetical protein